MNVWNAVLLCNILLEVVMAKPQYRAVIDPPARLVQNTIPLGVSSVVIRFCFREMGHTSGDTHHCPLGLQSYQNDNFDSPPVTLSLRNGALSLPPAYLSGVGLMVSILAVDSEGHLVTLGKYITGSVGGEPGTLVSTGLVRAEGDNGVAIWLRAVVGVKCIPEFTGPQCTTPLNASTTHTTARPTTARPFTQSPDITEALSTGIPMPATASTSTTLSSTAVSETPPSSVPTEGLTTVPVTDTASATRVTPSDSSNSTESLTAATQDNSNAQDLTTGVESPGEVTTRSQTLSETSASLPDTDTMSTIAFSPIHTIQQALVSPSHTPDITATGLGVGFLIGFVTATILAVLALTAVTTYCIRKQRQTQEGDKIELVAKLEFEPEKE